MPESLEEFLGKNKQKQEEGLQQVDGGYSCQDCLEICNTAYLNEEEMILVWYCTNGHRSQVSL